MGVNTMTQTNPFISAYHTKTQIRRRPPGSAVAELRSQATQEDLIGGQRRRFRNLPGKLGSKQTQSKTGSPGARPLNPGEFDPLRKWHRKKQSPARTAHTPQLPAKKEMPPWEHSSASVAVPFSGEDEATQVQFKPPGEHTKTGFQNLICLCLGVATGTLMVMLTITWGGWM